MTNLQSTAPAAHAWLVANIPAAVGIQTFNRSTLGTDLENQRCVVGEITNLVQEWAGFGNGRRDEEYDIGVLVSVFSGNDPTSLDVDALAATTWALVQDIVALISFPDAGDPTLGGSVIFCQVSKASELPIANPNGGAEFAVEFTIACRAQVQK